MVNVPKVQTLVAENKESGQTHSQDNHLRIEILILSLLWMMISYFNIGNIKIANVFHRPVQT